MIGWAAGGLVFGVPGDRIGRAKECPAIGLSDAEVVIGLSDGGNGLEN